jgi:membrane-associated protease RseP (regulator of RpoE activity)
MKARVAAQQVGIVLLLTLIIFVTYNDVMRLFR